MKIARFTEAGRTRLGVVEGDTMVDVGSAESALPTDLGQLLAEGGLERVRDLVAAAPRLALTAVRLEAPIALPPSFLAIGLNYRDHVAESGMEKPKAPMVFNKQTTCVTGPYDAIDIPPEAPTLVDYEGELGVVIGTRCRRVPADRAHEVVAGYLVVNDVSVRDWQMASATMTMGKSWDTHGPIGPWLVTTDEITDPHNLRLRTWVDDELRQDASTSMLIHDCWQLIEHLSTAFTLLPGTIIATGTPAGVGFVMKPPRCLNPNSRVRVEIEGIGTLDNPVVAEVLDTVSA
jgi:2-keto-4-pentenoate hydratase/2-oxohepta-3-ene-1,7-dioic acid hydratase in catechol pathway